VRTIDSLWYADPESPGAPPQFGVDRVSMYLLDNPAGDASVGVLEEYSGAGGPAWRTSAWVAAFVASELAGRPFGAQRFVVSAPGSVDGSSASALVAVGFLAAFRGDPVLPDRTLTGSITPDFSVTQVGGVTEKVRAAKLAGKRKVGVPVGQAIDDETEPPTDVIALGRQLGVEVVEVATLHDAYELLTGRALPLAIAAPAGAMALPALTGEAMRGHVEREIAEATRVLSGAVVKRGAQARAEAGRARRWLKEARRHLAQGALVGAHVAASRAASLARGAELLGQWRGDGRAPAKVLYAALDERARSLEKVLLAGSQGPLAQLEVAETLARARAALLTARATLDNSPRRARALRRSPARAASAAVANQLAVAESALEHAARTLRVAASPVPALRLDGDALEQMARGLAAVTTGTVEYIDALLLHELAERVDRPLEEVQGAFALAERSYLVAAQTSAALVASSDDDPGTMPPLMRVRTRRTPTSTAPTSSPSTTPSRSSCPN